MKPMCGKCNIKGSDTVGRYQAITGNFDMIDRLHKGALQFNQSRRLNSPPYQLASEAAFTLKARVESGSVGVMLRATTSNSKRLSPTPCQLTLEATFDLKVGVESGSKKGKLQSKKRRKIKTCSSVQPSSPAPLVMPSKQPTLSRFIRTIPMAHLILVQQQTSTLLWNCLSTVTWVWFRFRLTRIANICCCSNML
jgi:hypothetical protein